MISATRYAKASRKNKNVINKIQYSQFVTITFNYFSIKPLLNQKKINSKAKLLIKKEKKYVFTSNLHHYSRAKPIKNHVKLHIINSHAMHCLHSLFFIPKFIYYLTLKII